MHNISQKLAALVCGKSSTCNLSRLLPITGVVFFVCLLFNSCSKAKEDADDGVNRFVISEVMASNKMGLMAADGKLHDWIEIHNISGDTASLGGYFLCKDSGKVKWQFPDIKLKADEYVLVFASKKEVKGELSCGFKLKGKNESLQLTTHSGRIVSEVSYDKLKGDQALALNEKGKYKKTYEQTPGFENTDKGYEDYLITAEAQRKDPLRLWEFMVANIPSDTEGNKSRWVEIKNTSSQPIDLSQYSITSDKDTPDMLPLPQKELAPGAVLCIVDKKDRMSGVRVILLKNGEFVDGIHITKNYPGISVGRKESEDGLFFFDNPTPDAENNTKAYREIAKKPDFVPAPGVYDKKKELYVTLKTHGATVHFTTDGSLPTMASAVYKDSIRLDKTTVIRAFAEGDSTHLHSKIATATYFLNEKHTLPVINISVNKDDLYDSNRGIYVNGPGYNSEWPHKGANYWKRWTKTAHIEFYDKKGSFSEDCGLAIFGGFSRAESKKSFKIKFKRCYGSSSVNYDIFDEGKPFKMKNIVLRSGSQDMGGVMVRDEFFTSLMKQQSPTLLVQSYRPVALYINAEYFGLYYVREKIDKYFASHHLNVSTDSINIIMSKAYNEEGKKDNFLALLSYAKNNDLSKKEHYDYICSQIDLAGLVDQKLGQIYSSNTDVGNIRYIRSTDSGCDKKWYFVYYDIDASWVTNKPSSFYLKASGMESEGSVSMHNVLIHNLLKNTEFRKFFLERLSLHMHKTFTTQNTTAVFNKLTKLIEPEMHRNCERWPSYMSFENWQTHCQRFREKFKEKNKIILNDLRQELNITEEENKKYFSDLGF